MEIIEENNFQTKEIPDFLKLINELKIKAKEIKEQICITTNKVNNQSLKTNCGISLLDIKYHTLLQYITNLTFLIHLKLDGKSISNHPVISNLVELRIILEKIKPVEQKLKYQIDKLIRAATIENIEEKNSNLITNNITIADPLSFKPNPQDFVSKVDDKNEKDDKVEIYKAPKLAPVHFDEGSNSVREKEQSRLIARASKSRIMKDLIAEYDDKPEEIDVTGGVREELIHDKRIEEKLAERNRYEEENFIRLSIPKKELKKLSSSKKFENEFENFNDFNSLATIQEDVDSFEGQKMNVLARRNARKEKYRVSDDEDSLSQSHEHIRRDKQETFNGLLDDFPQKKKRKNKFQKAKKNLKSQKRR
ncbi:342_t:CDS:2, partial [Scutellospora calospora]